MSDTSTAGPLHDLSKEDLFEKAKQVGAEPTTSMSKGDLIAAITRAQMPQVEIESKAYDTPADQVAEPLPSEPVEDTEANAKAKAAADKAAAAADKKNDAEIKKKAAEAQEKAEKEALSTP